MGSEIREDAHAIIIGAMKSGTTSVYSYLENHPEICPAIIKEPEFFSQNQPHGVHVDDYNDLWTFDPSVHKYALEASTGYTKFPAEPDVAKKIFDYGIRPKFIYIVRNPFDRTLSHYNFVKNKVRSLDICDAQLVSPSDYFLQLEQYRPYFPKEDLLILDFETLEADPLSVLQEVYGFLGLSADYAPETFAAHNPTRLESKLEKRLRKSKLSVLSRYAPKPLKRLGTNLLEKLPSDRGALTAEERRFVHGELAAGMASFYHVYGFDVRKWGFDV